jgi:hypothetical protein
LADAAVVLGNDNLVVEGGDDGGARERAVERGPKRRPVFKGEKERAQGGRGIRSEVGIGDFESHQWAVAFNMVDFLYTGGCLRSSSSNIGLFLQADFLSNRQQKCIFAGSSKPFTPRYNFVNGALI